jgi:hypothetical protein
MGLLFFVIGIVGAYVISRRLNDIPVVEHEQPPTKYTRNDPARLFDKTMATSINGLAELLVKYDYVGENQWGVPMYDCYFTNGTITRLFGDKKMANLLAATGKAGSREMTSTKDKRVFKAEYAHGAHRSLVNQQPSQKPPSQV